MCSPASVVMLLVSFEAILKKFSVIINFKTQNSWMQEYLDKMSNGVMKVTNVVQFSVRLLVVKKVGTCL